MASYDEFWKNKKNWEKKNLFSSQWLKVGFFFSGGWMDELKDLMVNFNFRVYIFKTIQKETQRFKIERWKKLFYTKIWR